MKDKHDFENKYGICDSRNNYSEKELEELSKRKLYCIGNYIGEDGKVSIEFKKVYGYVSEDDDSCIFIKDKDITGADDKYYYPIKKIKYCTEIKKGIFHERTNDIIYCTTDELKYCLEYAKKNIKERIQSDIEDLKKKIKKLESASIEINELS